MPCPDTNPCPTWCARYSSWSSSMKQVGHMKQFSVNCWHHALLGKFSRWRKERFRSNHKQNLHSNLEWAAVRKGGGQGNEQVCRQPLRAKMARGQLSPGAPEGMQPDDPLDTAELHSHQIIYSCCFKLLNSWSLLQQQQEMSTLWGGARKLGQWSSAQMQQYCLMCSFLS